MNDHNPGMEGASEEALELELEPVIPHKEGEGEPGGDPLDDIKDETARAEAKAARAIMRRNKGKADPKAAAPKAEASEFLTKADFFKSNERKAILEATANPEVKANWDKIVPFFTPRRGKDTPEDVLEDIKDAIILFKARNPEVVIDDSKDFLTTTPVVKTGGGPTSKDTTKPVDPPNFKLPTQPADWYPKKK